MDPPIDPDFLLGHPDLVVPTAPWCLRLDNLELACLLLAQPWLAGRGLRPAEFERRLIELARGLPLGTLYFQRVRRALRSLEAAGALVGLGAARSRRYLASPEGLAALILNLLVPADDPTLDGSEFELKRALASMAGWLSAHWPQVETSTAGPEGELGAFFERAERLTVLARPALTEERIARAFDPSALVERQRRRVLTLLEETERRLPPLASRAGLARSIDLQGLARRLASGAPAEGRDPLGKALASSLAASALSASAAASVARYRAYLGYLDALATLHGSGARGDASAPAAAP